MVRWTEILRRISNRAQIRLKRANLATERSFCCAWRPTFRESGARPSLPLQGECVDVIRSCVAEHHRSVTQVQPHPERVHAGIRNPGQIGE